MAGIKELHALADKLAVQFRPPPSPPTDLSLEEQKKTGRGSLYDFVKLTWRVVEPHTPFVDGWHIRVICAHLEAVSAGVIRQLVINIPPRHMKSLIVGVFWPAWEWINHPERAYLTSSYADTLSVRDNVKMRRLIQSTWYRQRWGESFALTSDQNAKTRFDNNKGGYRIATSVGGVGTGEGGHHIVVDDPHNVMEALSDPVRMATLRWWKETMSTRGNDPKTCTHVVVMQRVHANDLAGQCIENGYAHLCLPAEFMPGGKVTPLVKLGRDPKKFGDPRTKPGELLWPQRFGPAELKTLKTALGSYGAAGQLQQKPTPEGGGTFKIAWFPRYKHAPRHGIKRVSIDCANKAKELSSFSVAGAFIETESDAYLLDVWRDRVEYPGLKRNVINFCEKHEPSEVLIEDKGNGTALIQDLRTNTRLPVIPIEPEGDKIMRAQRTSPECEARRIWLPEVAGWLVDFEFEITHFPNTDFLDQVDMLTQFIDRFARGELPGFATAGSRAMQRVSR